jgi:2,3-diketo-5-methylthio-1-phosphopentane phosphatase
VDLAGLSVFLDFDGTITTVDTGVHMLNELAAGHWEGIEEQYKSGRLGSRETIVRQWDLLPRDRRLIEQVVASVPLDPGFEPLVSHLTAGRAEVTILSDGYGFRAEEVGRRLGIPVITNAIDWNRHEVLFPNADLSCTCSGCGTCKRAPIKTAKGRGRLTILVGDGASDAKAAEVTDVVFAKEELAASCRAMSIEYRPFASLADILAALQAPETFVP